MMNLLSLNSKYLHSLVYFVADKPTKDNVSSSVPLVGTKSYKTLLNWIGEMDIDITRVRLYNQCDKPFTNILSQLTLNKAIELDQIKVIALGQKAANYLMETGIEEYYILPHPSGLNRQLNKKDFLKDKLGSCKTYIYEGVVNGNEKFKKGFKKNLSTEQILTPGNVSGKLE